MFLSSKQFDYNSQMQKFITEISSLGEGFCFDRIFPDSCDGGFTMVSAVTGRNVDFVVEREDRNSDGEIQGWNLVPTPAYIRTFPNLKGVSVLIIND